MTVFFRPGQQWKTFEVYKRMPCQDGKGRIFYTDGAEKAEEFQGFLSFANQEEIKKWKQVGHPITHRIILQGTCSAEAESVLYCNSEKYDVWGKANPGELGFFEILYCQKRQEGKEEKERQEEKNGMRA